MEDEKEVKQTEVETEVEETQPSEEVAPEEAKEIQ